MQRSNTAGLGPVPPRPVISPIPPRATRIGVSGSWLVARSRRLAARLALATALILLAIAGALGVMRSVYTDRIYPGVYVESVPVGGSDLDAARAAVQGRASEIEQSTVAFSYGGTTWTPSLSQLGVTIDVERTLNRAYAVGREENARDRLAAMGGLLRHDRRLPLLVTFDQRVLAAWLDGVDAELGLPPHDASLAIDGTTVTIVPEVDGTITDRGLIQQLVYDAALTLSPVDAPLPVVARVASVRAADLEDVRAQVEAMLARPVEVTFQKQSWSLDPAALGTFLTQSIDPTKHGAAAFSVGVDISALSKWLSKQIAPEINRDPVDAEVAWSTDKGELVAMSASENGYKLKPKTFAGLVAESLLGDHGPVEVPVVVMRPDVDSTSLDALGVTTRLAVGDSSYEGSNEGRATNIQVGASLLNGTLIPPGGEFSFNHAIGVIDKEKGYVDAPVIDGERIGRDVGGGICQVSTTVFRAALKGGMPITEWWPHTYRLGFYELDGWPPGMDASILQPEGDPFGGGDFKFVNPSDSWILVESYTQNNRVYVILYGADLGYSVTLSDPDLSDPIPPPKEDLEIVDEELPDGTIEKSELEQEGLEVYFERIVTDRDDNVLIRDTWETVFASRPDVWKVSPDMKGKSPAGKDQDG